MFRVTNISVINYRRDIQPTGNATVVWDGPGSTKTTEIKLQLEADDCAKILEIFSDRVQATLAATSNAIIEAQKPKTEALANPHKPGAITEL